LSWLEGTGLADVVRFLATAALGFAFVRGGWLVRWALETDRVGLGMKLSKREGGSQAALATFINVRFAAAAYAQCYPDQNMP
jgi:hypothetical protein